MNPSWKDLAAFLLCLLGGWVIVINYIVLFDIIRKKCVRSWIPLVGGSSVAIAFAISSLTVFKAYWFVPLLLDFGCIPGITHAVFYMLLTRVLSFRHSKLRNRSEPRPVSQRDQIRGDLRR